METFNIKDICDTKHISDIKHYSDIKDILEDINKLSSNLSELEEKYLYSQKQTETERKHSKIINQTDLPNNNFTKEKIDIANTNYSIVNDNECDIDLTKLSENSIVND